MTKHIFLWALLPTYSIMRYSLRPYMWRSFSEDQPLQFLNRPKIPRCHLALGCPEEICCHSGMICAAGKFIRPKELLRKCQLLETWKHLWMMVKYMSIFKSIWYNSNSRHVHECVAQTSVCSFSNERLGLGFLLLLLKENILTQMLPKESTTTHELKHLVLLIAQQLWD